MVDRSLLLHVNEVNQLALYLISVAGEQFGLSVDHDVALATAILHDVDKPLIHRRVKVAWVTHIGTTLHGHGSAGAAPTAEIEVAAGIVEMVRVHGHRSPRRASPARPRAPSCSTPTSPFTNDFAVRGLLQRRPSIRPVRYVHK